MIPHTVTDPACLYYQPSAPSKPRLRDWLRHPFLSRQWWAHDRARGKQCYACVPPVERFWIEATGS